MTITVYVVDDHPIVHQGVSNVLADEPGMSLVGAAESLENAIADVRRLSPTVILLDVRLGRTDVSTAVKDLRAAAPNSRVVLFTAHPGDPHIRAAFQAGAFATVVKEIRPENLRTTIKEAARGVLPDLPARRSELLTPRQRDVLERVAAGMTNAEIAVDLKLQVSTVKAYWEETMQRLGSRNRAEAIATAYDLGVF